jgi:2-isopropylmalate synthase
MKNNRIFIYDTTLRDGTQAEGISFSVEDKIRIAKKLDESGIDYIEGGWPGSNPKDIEFFDRMKKEKLKHAKLAAFGSTRRAKVTADKEENLKLLLESEAPVVTIFGKTWDLHVKDVLRVSLKENLDMIASSVKYLKDNKREVFYDAEHFFDGYKSNPEYALKTLKAAEEAGADCIILCDTNGGAMPLEIFDIINTIKENINIAIGIHCHNDSGVATANSIVAVDAGASHIQGTINGYGERCGNANLCSIIPNINLKTENHSISRRELKRLVDLSYYVSELANMAPNDKQPYVGYSAFAHKGGMHVNAVQKNPITFEHVAPETVGNHRRILISELAGKSNILLKAKEFKIGLDKESPYIKEILIKIKELEHQGYEFEVADASFNLLIRKIMGKHKSFFELEEYKVLVSKNNEEGDGSVESQATIKLKIGDRSEYVVAEGDGPVNALDNAMRKALEKKYPCIKDMQLTDYKVRVLNVKEATAAKVRVWVESRDEEEVWDTVGVSENVIEASWRAIVDSFEYKLMKEKIK